MPRRPTKTLTEAEQKVMEVLWNLENASVREVTEALSREKPVAYNTILTILGILHRKKYVEFDVKGRAHIYRPVISQRSAQREAFDQLLSRFFGGSKNAFAQYLVDEDQIDADELKRLEAMAKRAKDRPDD